MTENMRIGPYADFSGWRLQCLDFSDADLRFTKFADAELQECNFSHADMAFAILSRANLRKADLTGAKLWRAHLYETNLVGACLTGVIFDDADFYQVKMSSSQKMWLLLSGQITEEQARGCYTAFIADPVD